METNTFHCGECAETMRRHIPDNSIDLTVTSPPYDDLREYNGYTFDFEPIAAELWRVTKPGGVVVWVVGDATIKGSETGTSFRQALGFMALGFNLHDTMIWYKPNAMPQVDHSRFTQSFEYMFVFSKGTPTTANPIKTKSKYGGSFLRRGDGNKQNINKSGGNIVSLNKVAHNVCSLPVGEKNNGHPAIFPEALARDHIISWSNPGDIVLDPMCGSGTTLKMAVEQGRQYIGIDISQEYCDLSARRVAGARVPLPGLAGTSHNKSFKPNYYQPGLPTSKASED